jgi:hypothetical protein
MAERETVVELPWVCKGVRYSDEKLANRNVRDFGWEVAHAAVTRRPPISLYTMVPRTRGCMYAAKVWNLSIVQVPFSVAPCQSLALRFATLASLYEVELRVRVERLAANCPPPHHVPREQPSHGGRRTPERRRTLEARSVSPPLTPWCFLLMVTRFAASLPTDNSPQPKEAQPLSHALDNIRLIQHFDSSAQVWSGGGA